MNTYTFEETYLYRVEALSLEEAEETFQTYMESHEEREGAALIENYLTIYNSEGEEL
jgi:hypothetical protein